MASMASSTTGGTRGTGRHKHHIKEIVKEVVAEVSLKELRDVVVKSLDTEVHKRIDDVKTFGLEVFEDPATLLVDPPAVSMVRERLVRVERQVFKNAITFIPRADRPPSATSTASTARRPYLVIVVVASVTDDAATKLAARSGGDVVILTPIDLCSPGWSIELDGPSGALVVGSDVTTSTTCRGSSPAW